MAIIDITYSLINKDKLQNCFIENCFIESWLKEKCHKRARTRGPEREDGGNQTPVENVITGEELILVDVGGIGSG